MSRQEHLWLLSEESVLLDDLRVSDDGNDDDDDDDDEVILNTYGRGKLLSVIVLPRKPYTCMNVERTSGQTYKVQTQEAQEVVPGSQLHQMGRGRARLLKNRLEKVSKEKLPLNCRVPNGLKTFQSDSKKPCLPSQVPVESCILPAPPDYLHGNNYEDYTENFSSEMSSSSSLSLSDFPMLESPKKKKQTKCNSDSVSSQLGKDKTSKLSLTSLTDSILTSSKRNETSKSDEMNTDSCKSDDIQSSDELIVLDDDIETALDKHLSSLDDMSTTETSGACGGVVTSVDTGVYNNLTSSHQDTVVCDSSDIVMDWTLTGDNVIQCDGLPRKCDISVLEEIIASFGKIIDSQKIEVGNSSSVRFKLGDSDSCEWAVSCLHDSDCVYPDSSRVLECYRVDM